MVEPVETRRVALRSRPELGHSGLAARQGFLSPEALILKSTGSTRNDAFKLVAVGTMMADAEAAARLVEAALESPDVDAGLVAEFIAKVPWQAPIARAVTAGALSVDAGESIRSGLGQIDAAVTADKLGTALESLLTEASSWNADQAFKLARRMRDSLDAAGIAAREKQAHDDRFLKVYRLGNGNVRLFTEAQRAAMGVRDGGCRWVDCDRSPAWSEAHHINEWLADNGYTDLADGVLLCHPHHLLLHNQHWTIIRTGTEYWPRPPVEIDPDQTLITLPSKRPIP